MDPQQSVASPKGLAEQSRELRDTAREEVEKAYQCFRTIILTEALPLIESLEDESKAPKNQPKTKSSHSKNTKQTTENGSVSPSQAEEENKLEIPEIPEIPEDPERLERDRQIRERKIKMGYILDQIENKWLEIREEFIEAVMMAHSDVFQETLIGEERSLTPPLKLTLILIQL